MQNQIFRNSYEWMDSNGTFDVLQNVCHLTNVH